MVLAVSDVFLLLILLTLLTILALMVARRLP